ncbi:flagellar hook assembly protein FlgD [Glacieibacterium sp.]|uniref:flagellar hook assembly protein FlgD n=1 Tax=Glacieibacterium sp. TaxID=2860237 RepID=UPI003AFFB5B8
MTDAISGNYTQAPPAGPVHKTVLGQSDFLALMAAQLKNQDPTKPVENNEMIGQMAQFSQLTAQTAGNTSLDAIAAKLDTLIAATLSAKD